VLTVFKSPSTQVITFRHGERRLDTLCSRAAEPRNLVNSFPGALLTLTQIFCVAFQYDGIAWLIHDLSQAIAYA